ncbi:hypothetical protein DES53_101558 [Roseimicrobium gellanilyticum]|uniref:Uncharacterized protein n=1 Tax=Roseimicrobium gellanilyticum TaxID=748857 RepID=A0A366HVN5_9BACT|nr:hypothetical protein [Roseimicrobium gellanilyticum]RBP47759.1 hypothetical protein DES53_101558 [Roseimicrobium gellanilyticum]
MEPTPENIQAFRQARWRVRFSAHLIALHEGMSDRESIYWCDEREEYLTRHAHAKQSFAIFPREWSRLYP